MSHVALASPVHGSGETMGRKKKVHTQSQHDKTEAYEEGVFKCEIGCMERAHTQCSDIL